MIDLKKKYKTRGGTEVTLVSTEGRAPYPVLGYVGTEILTTCWTKYGKISVSVSELDLVEVKEVKTTTGWMNFYPDGRHAVHLTKEEADECAGGHRLACKEVTLTYVEGEGL